MRRATALLLVLLCAPASGRADDVADEAEFRFRRAADHYTKGRFEDALGEFFASNRLVRNKNVLFNIARTFEQLGRANEAFAYYQELLREEWSADDRKGLEAGIERLRSKVALVHVVTDPPGADVFIDRKDLGARGKSPRTIAMPVGPAKVLVELGGFRTDSRDVVLELGKQVDVTLPLERIWAFVAVDSTPPGAQVKADAELVNVEGPSCTAPCELRVLPGRHTLLLTLPGHVDARREVKLEFDEHQTLAVNLATKPPDTGKLVITANRENALVQVDGIEAGFTPVVLDAVPVGEHDVRVSYEDLETWKGKATVTKAQSATVRARLSVPSPKVAAAGKSLGSAADAAASVTVITSEEIRAFGWRTLTQVLRSVRGFYYTYDRVYEAMGVRGFAPPGDFNMRVQVLVDGHPWNDVWVNQAGTGLDFDVDLSQVERIEVVRGPYSALYGSSAVFGVVNVVHRAGPRQGTLEGHASIGSLGQRQGRITAGTQGADWAASATYATGSTQGDPLITFPMTSSQDLTLVRGHDWEGASHASAYARWKGLSLVAAFNDRSRQIPTTFGTPPRSRARDARGFVELRGETPVMGDGTLAARAYFDTIDYDAYFTYQGYTPYTELDSGRWVGSEVKLRTGLVGGALRFTAGVEFQHWISIKQHVADVSGTYLDSWNGANVLSSYAVAEWRPRDWLFIEGSLGGRVDQYQLTGDASFFEAPNVAPRLGVVARFYDDGVSKLVLGRAFRVPNIYERYYQDGCTSVCPPGPLNPESILSAELEHTHRVSEEVLFTAGAFANRLENVLSADVAPAPNDNATVVQNGEKAYDAVGGEIEARWQPSRLSLLAFTYSYQYSRDPQAAPGTSLPSVNSPAHTASLRAMQPLATGLTLGVEAVYSSPRRAREGADSVGESFLVNAVISGDLPRYRLDYAMGVYNLLDERVLHPVGSTYPAVLMPQYGRTVQLTASLAY